MSFQRRDSSDSETLANLYFVLSETYGSKDERRLRRDLCNLLERCIAERPQIDCLRMEHEALSIYHQRWADEMRRRYDGLIKTAEYQLSRLPPAMPGFAEVNAASRESGGNDDRRNQGTN